MHADVERAVLDLPIGHFGSGVVDRHRKHDLGALVLVRSEAGIVEVVIELEDDVRALGKAGRRPAGEHVADIVGAVIEGGGGVAVRVVPGLGHVGKVDVDVGLAGVLVVDPDAALAGVADQVVGELIDPLVIGIAVRRERAAVGKPVA